MLLGLGIDIVEISRMEKAVSRESFRKRVFTRAEQAYCDGRRTQSAAAYAVRWAGKESVLKAFGTGLRRGRLLDIEILPDAMGAPQVHLSGYYASLAEMRGVQKVFISLSHEREYAIAQCVLEGGTA